MKFSVVIVTYNRLELLKECLEHVQRQTHPFEKIIVINNKSTDGTKDYLESASKENPRLTVFNMEENLGGAGGFSYGLSAVDETTDYVLIIDDDAIINFDYIEKINSQMVPGIEAYSGIVSTNNCYDLVHRRVIKNNVLMQTSNVPVKEYFEDYFDYDVASFCGLVLKTNLIKKIGLPKTEYFIWFDDTEYSMRLRPYTKIRNINAAILNHKTKPSTSNKINWKSYYGYRNQIDLGLCHSAKPLIFGLYRILFHLYWILLSFKNIILKKETSYNRNRIQLHFDVLKYFFDKKLGINQKYKP